MAAKKVLDSKPLREWGVIITGAIGYSVGFIVASVIFLILLSGVVNGEESV